MNSVEEICGTCEFYQDNHCLMWGRTMDSGSHCHRWEINQDLLPTLEEIQAIYRLYQGEDKSLRIPANEVKPKH